MGNVSGYGGNLTFPVRVHLLNTIDADDIGLYTDSLKSDERILAFKKLGITIPHRATNERTVITPLPGEYKSVRLVVNPACPCEDCNYEYGIAITKEVKKPGIDNSDYYPTSRFYGDKLFRIGDCVSGIMAAVDITKIESTIMNQIAADKGGGMENSAPAIVGAKRYIIITDSNNANESTVDITHGGVTTTITSVTAAWNIAAVFNATSAVNQKLICYQLSKVGTTSVYMIVSKDDNYEFSAAAGTHTAVTEKGLLLTAKSKNVQFEVEAQPGIFEVKEGISLTSITGATYTDTNRLEVKIDGSTIQVPFDTNIGTSVEAILTAQGDKFGVAAAATVMYVALNPSYGKKLIARSTVVASNALHKAADFNHSSAASFPFFTPEDVFKEFANLRHLGGKENLVYSEKPIKGVEYIKWNISVPITGHGDMHGASHGTDYKIGYTFYIRKSVWESATDIVLSTGLMDAAADITADKTLAELITYWLTDSW